MAASSETREYIEGWRRNNPTAMAVLPSILTINYYGNNCVIVKR